MGRSWLTTPPGQEPETEDELRAPSGERYSRGFELPREPVPPTRHGRKVLVSAAVVLVAALGVLAFRFMTSGQDFDPALVPQDPAPTSTDTGLDPAMESPG